MHKSKGFTLIELMLVIAIIALIAAFAIPNLLRSRMSANEAAATGSIRTISTGEIAYQTAGVEATTNGIGKYGSLTSLGVAAAPFIDPNLGSGIKQGYLFEATPVLVANAVPKYTATATPGSPGKTGIRTFFVDESGVVRFDSAGGVPSSTSPPLN